MSNPPVIRTFTGKLVNPLDLRHEDIDIVDIAHALSLCNRFAGHTKFPISVAQHSVFVAKLCPWEPLTALLHDASEAYLGDVTKWLKHSDAMAGYREAEERAQRVIYEVFDCALDSPPEIEVADRLMVQFEGRAGFGDDFLIDHPNYPPLTQAQIELIKPWTPLFWWEAEKAFLSAFDAC
jgi:hypothetical protein